MFGSVISLSSSDEDESTEPPRKKLKTDASLEPQVTVTLVSTPKNEKVETVTLDSDDEIQVVSQKPTEPPSTNGGKDADLIMLIGDVEEPKKAEAHGQSPKVDKTSPNKKNNSILVIDSDSDTETPKTKPTDSNISDAVVHNGTETLNSGVDSRSADIVLEDSGGEAEKDDDDGNTTKATSVNSAQLLNSRSKKKENHVQSSIKSSESADIVIEDSEGEPEINEAESSKSAEDDLFKDSLENTLLQCTRRVPASSPTPGTSQSNQNDFAEVNALFKTFLKTIKEKLADSEFEKVLPQKLPIIEKYFKKSACYVNEKAFQAMLKETTETITLAPNSDAANKAVIGFHKVFESLKSYTYNSAIEIEEDHLPKVKKLEKIIKQLRKKIKHLEEAEVNFDDDENSSYIMLDRYQNRMKKLYLKYCKFIRRNPLSGRAIYDRIQFVHSKYNVINQALSRKYRNSVEFPSYHDVEKFIGTVAIKENLNLNEQSIRVESEKCFKHLGNILQKKRRQELYDSHLDFIEFTSDPASRDSTLENSLRKNYAQGKEKLDTVYQKYVQKQELGEDHVSSEGEESSDSSVIEVKPTTKVKANGKIDDQVEVADVNNSEQSN